MDDAKIHARIWQQLGDGGVLRTDIEIPARTGEEGFAWLEAFERRCGGPVRDKAREARWLRLTKEMAERKRKAGA